MGETLTATLKSNAQNLAELLAGVAPKAMWDADVPALSDLARRAQGNPEVLFVVFQDAQGQNLTRYPTRCSTTWNSAASSMTCCPGASVSRCR